MTWQQKVYFGGKVLNAEAADLADWGEVVKPECATVLSLVMLFRR